MVRALRCRHGVTIFKAEHSVFVQWRVEDVKRCLVLSVDVLQGEVAFGGFFHHNASMPVGEGPPDGVLSAESHRVTLQYQGAIGKQFTQGPVNPVLCNHYGTILHQFDGLSEESQVLGKAGDFAGNHIDLFPGYPRLQGIFKFTSSSIFHTLPFFLQKLLNDDHFLFPGAIKLLLQVGVKFLLKGFTSSWSIIPWSMSDWL